LYEFEYAAPSSVDEAVSILAENGDDARILAGGTDIIAQLKENRRRLKVLVDVKKIPEANELTYDASAGLHMGAAVPCYKTYDDPTIHAAYPCLTDATSLIGSVQIQSRATVAGNLCNSSPAADGIPALIALGATAKIVGPNGTREVAAEDFCTAPGRNVLENGELVISIHIPAPEANSGGFSLRFIPRNEMDIAVVNAAAYLVLSDDKKSIVSARLAMGAVAPTPLYLKEAGDLLAGQQITDELIEEAAGIARAAANPITDMRGTIEQRTHLAGVLSRRAIKGAIERAKGS
jgi:CO/xanthine dehydrogenase FAD-binding subunit